MSSMLSNSKTFQNCQASYCIVVTVLVILRKLDDDHFSTNIIADGRNWLDEEDLIIIDDMFREIEYMSNQETLDYLVSLKERYVFLLYTLMMRYFHYNFKRVRELCINHYEDECAKPSCTDHHRLNMGNVFKAIDHLIDDSVLYLLAEDETISFAVKCTDDKFYNRYIHFGDRIPMRPDFALNVGVEKSRITTLKGQAVLKAERKAKALEDEALIKALEEAKPEKVSKKSQTKSANKKKEQEKKEREEYEKRSALAEAERQRQLKKKQEQKKAKKAK
jgi:hypothetical protein